MQRIDLLNQCETVTTLCYYLQYCHKIILVNMKGMFFTHFPAFIKQSLRVCLIQGFVGEIWIWDHEIQIFCLGVFGSKINTCT